MRMTDIVLVRTVRVKKILKKSRAKAFDNTLIGDILHFSIKFKPVGSSARGTHAAYVEIVNMRTSEKNLISFNKTYMYDDLFELEEV